MNVLLIMTDQHQAQCTGYENHPQAITPNLDRLAGQSLQCRHAYTANPICTPTRVSLLSGQYPHNTGYFGLGGPTPKNLPSFLGHFREAGYGTAAVGKLHLPDDPIDWADEDCDFYFNIMGGNTAGGMAYEAYLAQHGFPGEFDCNTMPDGGPGNYAGDARPSRLPFEHSAEGFTNQNAMAFMDNCLRKDKPFCMEVSYHRPHQCYTPAQEFWDMYDDDLELPPGAQDDLNPDRPPHFLRGARGGREDWSAAFEPRDSVSRQRRVWKGYLACITHCDHAVGQLMAFLEERGIADNTIVVYTSDHGAYSGTFGINEKAPGICSEQICRVPMLWRVPGVTDSPRTTRQLAHLIDLGPTFASLTGLDPMGWVDGHDLSPLITGSDEPVRSEAVTEHVWSKSIRWDRWRLVHYQPEMFGHIDPQWRPAPDADIGELYDIEADPLEQRNLYHDPEYAEVVQAGRRRLLEWLIRTTRCVTYWPPHDASGQRRRVETADGMVANNAGPAAAAAAGSVNYL